MKLYLDMCCLKRPFDDQTQARIQVETQAVEAILQLCRDGHHHLVTSDALRFENANNPNRQRQQFAEILLGLARHNQQHSSALENQAQIWQNAGIGLLDALHLASAELCQADRFASCDDVLLHRAGRVTSAVRILSLLDLFKELIP